MDCDDYISMIISNAIIVFPFSELPKNLRADPKTDASANCKTQFVFFFARAEASTTAKADQSTAQVDLLLSQLQ